MRRLLLILSLLTFIPLTTQGQYIRVSKPGKAHTLYLDLDHIFNYNLYEHTRWGIGFLYVGNMGKKLDSRLSVKGYGAFGVEDRAVKYGIDAQYRFAGKPRLTLLTNYCHDIEHAASTQLEQYQLTKIAETGAFMTSRYSLVDRFSIGGSTYISKHLYLAMLYRHSREQYLFNSSGIIYPLRTEQTPLPTTTFNEVDLKLSLRSKVKLHLLLGLEQQQEGLSWSHARLLAQYKQSLISKKRFPPTLWCDLFAQAGITSLETPYSRLFDLSGTAQSHLFFNDALHTVLPNTFTANLFARGYLRLNFGKPLWKVQWSTPRPFLQVGAAWGALYGSEQTLTDHLALNLHPNTEPLQLQAPYLGLLEPAMGINELLRWRFFNIGVAAAYQLTLPNAPYHQDAPLKNLAVMGTLYFTIK